MGIVDNIKREAYLNSLPEVETSRLPQDTLFWAQDRIYQVTETGAGGFHKAREWRKTEKTDVALIPGSFPARFLPLVARGKLLPVYRSRQELTDNDQPTCFVFPTESLALSAAALDVALIHSGGAYVRNHAEEPAFAATDGVHVFRLYYFRTSATGRKTNLSKLEVRPLPFVPKAHTKGPGYWRLLPGWMDTPTDLDVTQPIKPVSLARAIEETRPNLPGVSRSDSPDQIP